MTDNKFSLTREGFLEAEAYLRDIGEWERVSKADGYSIVDEANRLWRKRGGVGQQLDKPKP